MQSFMGPWSVNSLQFFFNIFLPRCLLEPFVHKSGKYIRNMTHLHDITPMYEYAVKVRRHTPWSRVRCHGCRFSHSQFHSQFHSRRYSLRITLKYTILVRMRISPREPARHDNGASDVWALTEYTPLLWSNGMKWCFRAIHYIPP